MVGLLLDSLSQNTGDQAILDAMVSFLKKEQQAFEVLSPLRFDAQRYQPIIVGGGHLIRPREDWFYDAFRVAGPHILNATGVSTSEDLDYLREYVYVSVRSRKDLARVAAAAPGAEVCPCVSLSLAPEAGPSLAPPGCIGFHFHAHSWAAAGDEGLFSQFADYPQCLIPVTYYNNDFKLLGRLHERAPVRLTLLPRLAPRAVLREIGRMRALVCSSLHAAIFAYSQNVPFLAFGQPPKLAEFMEDRGLQRWMFRDRNELGTKLAALLDRAPDYTAALQRDFKRQHEHFARLASCLPRISHSVPALAVGTPGIEHKLLIEHQNRIDQLEEMADRLLVRSDQLTREVSREEVRITELRQMVETSQRTRVQAAPKAGAGDAALPFGCVESPVSNTAVTDRCRLSGWALSASGVSEVVVYLDGRLASSAGHGESRPDVARAYPGFPDNPFAGWTITLDMTALPDGLHELLVQARSRTGSSRDLGVLSLVKTGAQVKDAAEVALQAGEEVAQRQNPLGCTERPQSLSQSLQCLRSRVGELEQAHQQLCGRLENLTRTASDLGCSLDTVPIALEGFRDDLGGLRQALANLHASAGATRDESHALSAQVSSLSVELSSISAGVSNLTERASRLERRYRRVITLGEEHGRLQDRLEGLTAEASGLRGSLHAVRSATDAVRGELDVVKGALAELEAGRDSTQSETRAFSGHLSSLSADVSSLSTRVSSLSESIDRHELASRQASEDKASQLQQLSDRLSALECQLQSSAERLGAVYASRIWRTLQTLAAPLDSLIRVARTLASRARRAPALPVSSPTVGEHSFEGASSAREATLQVGIDSEIPSVLPVGEGNVLVVSGWCYHPTRRIRKLEIATGATRHPARLSGLPRPDVCEARFPGLDPKGHSLSSGFSSLVVLPRPPSLQTVDLVLHATLDDGQQCTVKFASTTLMPECEPSGPPIRLHDPDRGRPLVAICMVSYNPPLELLARQMESLIGQEYTNWIGIISDDWSSPAIYEQICALARRDPRFHVRRPPQHVGFYENFEHCLSLVPPEAEFVALCDQDDYWHRDKLSALLAAFRPGATLVYSDMNIVDDTGRILSSTYWSTRRNNYTSLASLLLANTITGAACMFRRSLVKTLLPFPRTPGAPYHDHWIGCVALAAGEIAYLDRPLYDYVQHPRNVIGHFAPPVPSWFQNLLHLLRNPSALRAALNYWRSIYFGDVLRLEVCASVLQLRGSCLLSPRKRRVLNRFQRLDASLTAPVWLAVRPLRRLWRGNETLGAETRLLRGILWKHLTKLQVRLAFRPGRPPASGAPGPPPVLRAEADLLRGVELIRHKVAPLLLRVSPSEPQRVNLLIPTIDFSYLFGGYLAKLNLARKLAETGFAVRILIVDYCDYNPARWRSQLRGFEGLASVLDSCELACVFDRSRNMPVSPRDVFIATTWWTAYIAQDAVRKLGKNGFLYLIQEYEPFTFPMGSLASMAAEAYNWPHYALFSTPFLREYFRQQSLGIYGPHAGGGDVRATTFNNAVTRVEPVTRQALASRPARKLLFYARPEEHAARNMFELGVLALCAVLEDGGFGDSWEFNGIGAVSRDGAVPLAGRRRLRVLQRKNQPQYSQLLAEHDLGLSLMYTPHPSLVPIEMAAAGMVVVTNTFGNKTSEALGGISRNIIAVEPSLEALAAGLRAGVARVEDFDARAVGSRVHWPRNWEEALNPEVIARVSGFLKELAR